MDFEQKRKFKKFVYSKPVLVALFLLVFFVGKATWNVYDKLEMSKLNLEKEMRELQKLQERQAALASQIDYLQTDQGVEAEIRKKYRVVKEGEEIAVIIDDDITLPEATTTPKRSFWKFWKE